MHDKLVTPWSRVLVEKQTVCQLVRKFSTFYGTRRFFTVFTRTCHLSLPRVRSSCHAPLPILFLEDRFDIILQIHALVFQVASHPGVSPPKPCMRLSSHVYAQHAICPAHLILLDLITRILCGETYGSFHIITECNRSMHSFNGAIVDCSYVFLLLQSNHYQAV
jgi:hypothetical protein